MDDFEPALSEAA
jgi:hypothetical protein